MSEIPAYILSGGRSSRFGSDKARTVVAGTPNLLRLVHSLEKQFSSITVVASRADQYLEWDIRTIGDDFPFGGPLWGLARALADRQSGWALVLSCDMIDWDSSWLERLNESREKQSEALAVAFYGDRWDPFPGLYHADLQPLIARQLSDGHDSLQQLLNHSDCRALRASEAGLPPRFSFNTLAELQAQLKHRGERPAIQG